MKAVLRDRYGLSGVLRVDDIPTPTIDDTQVLVRIGAAGVGLVDWHLTTGRPYIARLALGVRRPRHRVAGVDVAGTVEAVGSKVTRFQVGDAVLGTAHGSFAELVAAREDRLVRRPDALSVEQAAALPVAGCAALTAIDAARVGAGQRVLVLGAGGGVGHLAVQIAVARGADVTAVTSASKVDLVRGLGAARVVLRHELDGVGVHDAILDTGGGRPLRQLRGLLAPRGTLAIIGDETGGSWVGLGRQLRAVALSPFTGQRLLMIASTEKLKVLEPLIALTATGQVAPVVTRSAPLEAFAGLLHELEAGTVAGKAVLVP